MRLVESDDDPSQLLAKVSNVLPDLNRLLHSYHHTHTQLSSKEQQSRATEKELADSLQKKNIEVDALRRNFSSTLDSQAIECRDLRARCAELEKIANECKELRLEVGHLRDTCKDLTGTLDDVRKSQEETLKVKASLETENDLLRKKRSEQAATHLREIENVRTMASREMDIFRKNHSEALSQKQSAFVIIQGQLADQIQKHAQETDLLKGESQRDLANSKIKLDLKQRELDGTTERHRHEIEVLQRAREHDRTGVDAKLNEQLAQLRQTHQQTEAHLHQRLDALSSEVRTKQEENMGLSRERDDLTKSRDDEKTNFRILASSMSSMKSVLDSLSDEKKKLDKTLQSLGQATEMKSKGDTF